MDLLALGKTSTSAHPWILLRQEHTAGLWPDSDPIKLSQTIYRISLKNVPLIIFFFVKGFES